MKETTIYDSQQGAAGSREPESRHSFTNRGVRAAQWKKSKWFDNWLRLAKQPRRDK